MVSLDNVTIENENNIIFSNINLNVPNLNQVFCLFYLYLLLNQFNLNE